jgi:hypothetical protein
MVVLERVSGCGDRTVQKGSFPGPAEAINRSASETLNSRRLGDRVKHDEALSFRNVNPDHSFPVRIKICREALLIPQRGNAKLVLPTNIIELCQLVV